MLSSVLQVGDIRDVEKLCDRIVSQSVGSQLEKRSKLSQASGVRLNSLSGAERDDLLAYLIGETWVLWTRYETGRGAKFSTYAIPQLRLRVIDWYRKRLGRGASPGEWGLTNLETLDEHELERVLGQGGGDDPYDRFPDLGRLLAPRGGEARGRVAAGGRGAPRRVA